MIKIQRKGQTVEIADQPPNALVRQMTENGNKRREETAWRIKIKYITRLIQFRLYLISL